MPVVPRSWLAAATLVVITTFRTPARPYASWQPEQHPCGSFPPHLTGYKIPVIENLGATLDQFDAIDFSDNEIRKLDGFPLLRRLKTLLVNNNRICRIGEGLDQALPCLTDLILTNNSLVELGDLDPLAALKSLTYLSILRNPVTNKKHYRLYVIYKVPQIRVLDFQKVKLKVSAALPVASRRGCVRCPRCSRSGCF
ncbi:U2 small nuclear ribonucleoprotein A' [Pteropus vampyrus]|uniref:U2 small nuclear ribonucleoprotein A' n=1 Tax=Pteropus vampyrus TaxID=132908 RepID=A0A6P3RMF6_PTEVA|nr:U2 small nuclear ribonucleoprotein A' [Pteropus vampyrus]